MRKKLKLFTPNNLFKIEKRLLVVSLLWGLVFLIYTVKYNLHSNRENIETLGFLSVIISLIYSLYFLISNFYVVEDMNGEFNGYLTICADKIICHIDVYSIDEIRKVSILSNYIKGTFNGNTTPWKPKKSNGVKNYIEIFKEDGSYKKYFFLQTKTENITMFAEELTTYYRQGKINEQNYKNIFE